MSSTEFYLIRHGETEANASGRWQGHEDSALTMHGESQAEALGRRLAGTSFAALYSSDLGRAYNTAKKVAGVTGLNIVTDQRLRERHLGIFQGRTREENARDFPEEWKGYLTGGPDYVIPAGESARQRLKRSVQCLEEIAARHSGERVAVVSHGGVLSGLMRVALGIPLTAPRAFQIWNAGINIFMFADGKWRLNTWGDICHLDGALSLSYE